MGVISRADFERRAADAVPISLGDVRRQAQAMLEEAESEARRVLEEARAARESLIKGGREAGHAEGFQQGRAEGLEQGRTEGRAAATEAREGELKALSKMWSERIDEFDRARELLLTQAREDVLTLALRLAELATARTVEVDPGVAEAQLARALERIAEPTMLRIRHCPSDADALNEGLPGIVAACEACKHAELVPDQAVSAGSVVIHTEGGGRIDAEIESSLARLSESLRAREGGA
ncbi:MAG: FliH/SctL family protein [Planctomycetota bacterium]